MCLFEYFSGAMAVQIMVSKPNKKIRELKRGRKEQSPVPPRLLAVLSPSAGSE